MTSRHRQRLGRAALALCLLAGCSKIGDGNDGSADAGGLPDGDGAPRGPDAEPPDAGSGPIETLVVPSDGTAASTTAATTTGETYRLEASGVFKWGNCDLTACPGAAACGYERLGDAYHRTDDCWASTTSAYPEISLYVDGEQVDWGPYDADHVYTLELPGTGAPLTLEVMDCVDCYLDNRGDLTVDLYRQPGG